MPITDLRVPGRPPSLYEDGDTPRARRADPDTSHAAADSTQKDLSILQGIVMSIFRTEPEGLTDSELDRVYSEDRGFEGWPVVRYETPRKRRSDLTSLGLLVDSGERRLNGYNRAEVVWVVAS